MPGERSAAAAGCVLHGNKAFKKTMGLIWLKKELNIGMIERSRLKSGVVHSIIGDEVQCHGGYLKKKKKHLK